MQRKVLRGLNWTDLGTQEEADVSSRDAGFFPGLFLGNSIFWGDFSQRFRGSAKHLGNMIQSKAALQSSKKQIYVGLPLFSPVVGFDLRTWDQNSSNLGLISCATCTGTLEFGEGKFRNNLHSNINRRDSFLDPCVVSLSKWCLSVLKKQNTHWDRRSLIHQHIVINSRPEDRGFLNVLFLASGLMSESLTQHRNCGSATDPTEAHYSVFSNPPSVLRSQIWGF